MLCVLKSLHHQVSNAYFMRNVSLIVFVLSLIVYIYFLIIVMFLSSTKKKVYTLFIIKQELLKLHSPYYMHWKAKIVIFLMYTQCTL